MRLFDSLRAHFGMGSVLMDVDTIQLGASFTEAIDQTVSSCDVLVAVIGKAWLSTADAGGRRRLDDPQDFVRLEIQSALEHKVRVVPVLVVGAQTPRADQLPSPLATLAGRIAFKVSDRRWQHDAERLITALEKPVE